MKAKQPFVKKSRSATEMCTFYLKVNLSVEQEITHMKKTTENIFIHPNKIRPYIKLWKLWNNEWTKIHSDVEKLRYDQLQSKIISRTNNNHTQEPTD